MERSNVRYTAIGLAMYSAGGFYLPSNLNLGDVLFKCATARFKLVKDFSRLVRIGNADLPRTEISRG